MTDLNQAIGDRIKQLRSQRGLTLDQAADLTGVSKSMIGQIERGNSAPRLRPSGKSATGSRSPFHPCWNRVKRRPAWPARNSCSP